MMRRFHKRPRGLTLVASATVACLVAAVVLLGFYTTYGNYVRNIRGLHLKEVARDIAHSRLAQIKSESALWYAPKIETTIEEKERFPYTVVTESRVTPKADWKELIVTVSWAEQSRQRETCRKSIAKAILKNERFPT